MAREAKIRFPELFVGGSFDEGSAAQEAEMNRLQAISDALPAGEIVGAVLQFPAADSHALYVVTKAAPLTVAHIPYMDAWRIPVAHVRGLTVADVKAQLKMRAAFARMFAKKEVTK